MGGMTTPFTFLRALFPGIPQVSTISSNESASSPSGSNTNPDGSGVKPLRIALKWRKISEKPEETIIGPSGGSNGGSHDIEGEGLMVEHEEAFDEDEFTRRVLGDDGMSSGSEDHGEIRASSPVMLNKPRGRRSLREDDDCDEVDDDDDDDGVVSSSDEDDDDVVDLIKVSMPQEELHSLHMSDDDLEDVEDDDDDEIDSDDESELPSVLPLRVVKGASVDGGKGGGSAATVGGAGTGTSAGAGAGNTGSGSGGGGVGDAVEEVDIITLDKIDEQLADPTIVMRHD
ncbi:uncharacterized protein DFL_008843 [Arthrobotrys flagrans]|uniref:Uncharacterized protein n=1 Tax=Arthrobotrys flagrans TaxID=97331 RepID=A0A436ZPY4_ARTFL|nr:hypothetical protein DFL_008843 [Arthrobotrys flagrans]